MGKVIHFFFTEPGPGGVFVLAVLAALCFAYALLLRWIAAGARVEAPTRRERWMGSEDR